MGQRPPETVELPHHQTIARLEERQRLRKARAIVVAAAGTIFKQVPLIDSLARIGWSAGAKLEGSMNDAPTAIERGPDRRAVRSAH